MSRGFKNRQKKIRDERLARGADPRPHQNQLMTPRSSRMRDIRRIWLSNARRL
jgi:hypothetical protein